MMAALGLGTTTWGGRRPSVSTERESKLRRDQIVADLREEMGKGDKMAILMVHFGSAYAEAREALGRMRYLDRAYDRRADYLEKGRIYACRRSADNRDRGIGDGGIAS